jgi:pimeloyl-ACP methyl ester carboxylesterase
VRQPQVVRDLLALLLAALLVAPVALTGWSAIAAAAFLVEFLSGSRWWPLSAVTPTPVVRPLAVPGVAADVHEGLCPVGRAGCALVLVHGLAPAGKDDPRLRRAASLLARTGFAVAVPTIPGLTRRTLRAGDVEVVVRTIQTLPPPARLAGVSVGAGPALLAAADPRTRDRVVAVLSLGGYGSALELVRFHLRANPAIAREFVEANPDLVDASTRRALAARDLALLSPAARRYLEALSPERVAGQIRARLLLVHGRDDPLVPFGESLRLQAAARPGSARLAVVGVIGHVEQASVVARLADLARLWAVAYELVVGRWAPSVDRGRG